MREIKIVEGRTAHFLLPSLKNKLFTKVAFSGFFLENCKNLAFVANADSFPFSAKIPG
jgi:hypothetical protein